MKKSKTAPLAAVRGVKQRSRGVKAASPSNHLLLPSLRRAIAREVVRQPNSVARVVMDVQVTKSFPKALRAALALQCCADISSEYGEFSTVGLAFRVVKPGERTIGYSATARRAISEGRASEARNEAFRQSLQGERDAAAGGAA